MKNIGLNPRQSKKFEEEYFFSKLNIEKIDLKLFNEMENAIKKRLKTEIEYKKENVEKKIIKPLKILNFEGYWYVGALNEKNEYRTYHLKSIKKLNTTQKKFKIKKTVLKDLDNAINIWFDPTKKPFEVELQIDNKIIKYLKRIPLSKTQIIIERKDYSIIRLKITHKNEIKRIILSWIPHIVVVTPSGLKKEIDEEVRKYYLKYAK
jgi:predicted DNA-binding transcriptional regulator YafY